VGKGTDARNARADLGKATVAGSSRDYAAQAARSINGWVRRVRDRVRPSYVDWADVPDEPPPPYRARLTVTMQSDASGVDVSEREVVRGEMEIVYEVRCACGKRWFSRRPDRLQICPRCDCAVLLDVPERPAPDDRDEG
jgi:hypothetical protein